MFRYLAAKAEHDRKIAKGEASMTDEVAFTRLEKQFKMRKQRAEMEMRHEWEDHDIVLNEPAQETRHGALAVDEDT